MPTKTRRHCARAGGANGRDAAEGEPAMPGVAGAAAGAGGAKEQLAAPGARGPLPSTR